MLDHYYSLSIIKHDVNSQLSEPVDLDVPKKKKKKYSYYATNMTAGAIGHTNNEKMSLSCQAIQWQA